MRELRAKLIQTDVQAYMYIIFNWRGVRAILLSGDPCQIKYLLSNVFH